MIVVLASLAGCRTTRFVEVPVVKTDTLVQLKAVRDSVWLHDSVFVHEYAKGDTVYRDRDRWHTQWRERILTDTVYHSRIDSVGVPYPVEVQVAKPLTTWQRIRIHMGEALLALLTIGGAALVIRLRKH